MKQMRLWAGLLVVALTMTACVPVVPVPAQPVEPAEAEEASAELGTIVDIAVGAGDFNTLVAAVTAAGLAETLQGEGPFTVFAPTDAAFAALPEGTVEALLEDPEGALTDILLYHVVAGKVMSSDLSDGMTAETVQGSSITVGIADGVVTIDDATVVVADIEASNGVIHVIDAVILPPAEEEAAEEEAAAELGTIVDIAVDAGDFNTLVAAITAAGLVETLQGEGPFTVFAPTDAAFAALPEGTVEALLEDPEGALTDILLYHVVAGEVMSGDLSDGMTAETVQGSSITVGIVDGVVTIDGATVVAADIEASNGVIHVIDAVILPLAE
ncbi:MAG: fasciclin domain-containing protein [Chloroflexi bacterium]|nr:fasciclin domain-containing protein [Chloroflexota bacterium]